MSLCLEWPSLFACPGGSVVLADLLKAQTDVSAINLRNHIQFQFDLTKINCLHRRYTMAGFFSETLKMDSESCMFIV